MSTLIRNKLFSTPFVARVISFVCILLFVNGDLLSQGLVFTENLNWDQVQQKAKAENKLIFIDCFATWCMPCKEMDKTVYASKAVGEALSSKIISVKVQMDSTARDNEMVRKWRTVSRGMEKQYAVNAYPSYLFFSSSGVLVHRGEGVMSSADFTQLVNDANNPDRQYYSLMKRGINSQSQNDSVYEAAFKMALKLRDGATAKSVARKRVELLEKSAKQGRDYNVSLVKELTSYISAEDKTLFQLFYLGAKGKGVFSSDSAYCKGVVTGIIERDEIMKQLVADEDYGKPLLSKPNWKMLKRKISKKYNDEYADRVVLTAQKKWYRSSAPDKNELAKAIVAHTEKYIDLRNPNKIQMHIVNNLLWSDVFLQISDKALLKRAAVLQQAIIVRRPDQASYLDTYANLLYRAGEKEEAIKWEEIAVNKNPLMKENVANLEKIKQGLPTW